MPLLALRRPGWTPVDGDRWHPAGSLEQAAELLPGLGARVFLATGRLGLAAFAGPSASGALSEQFRTALDRPSTA